VLEHLPDPWGALRSFTEELDPGGVVVLSLPNVGHLDTYVSLLFRGCWPYRSRSIHDATHLRHFARENVHALLAQAGLAPRRFERVYRLVEAGSPIDAGAPLLAWLPPLRELLTFQFLVVAERTAAVTSQHQTWELPPQSMLTG
jgi:hypothetical protein